MQDMWPLGKDRSTLIEDVSHRLRTIVLDKIDYKGTIDFNLFYKIP